MSGRTVTIHYHRPPDRLDRFEQTVVAELDGCTVTLLASATRERTSVIEGEVVLEPGSPVVWFTYPGLWHDIGRFHREDGTFTGIYANVLTPVVIEGDRWETTDLFLDVWVGRDGKARLLDEAELAEAETGGWIDAPTAARARREAVAIMEAAARGLWPPAEVHKWTLERALRYARSGDGGGEVGRAG